MNHLSVFEKIKKAKSFVECRLSKSGTEGTVDHRRMFQFLEILKCGLSEHPR